MLGRFGAASALFVCAVFGDIAQAETLSCANPVRLNGEVKTGNDFVRAIPGTLMFALEAERKAPPNPYGWTIRIHPGAAPQQDLVWAANPPYRGLNVRDLTLSYGQTAERVVAQNPRAFAFYTDSESNAQAEAWLQARATAGDAAAAPATEMPKPRGRGELKIDSYVFATSGSTKIIAKMKFHVTLCMTQTKEGD